MATFFGKDLFEVYQLMFVRLDIVFMNKCGLINDGIKLANKKVRNNS